MRVLHVTPSHARRDGGPSETLRGLIPELVARGVEIDLLSTDKGLSADDADIAGICQVTMVRSRRPASWNFAPGVVRELWRRLGELDVVHIHSVNTFPTTVAMVLSRLRRVPYVLEPHGALDHYHLDHGAIKKRFYNQIIDAFGYAGLSAAVYSSRRESCEGARTLRAPAVMMPLGVDETLFTLPRRTGIEPVILYLGRIAHKKRLDLVIRALAEPLLSDSGAHLVVAGPLGDDLDYEPAQLAASLGVGARVSFLGRVGAQQRRDLLATSDVFVLPSEDESFGVAVAEAMAAGCPVITSSSVGLALEAAAEEAVIVAALEPAAVAASVAAALNDAEGLSARGRAYATARFRWSAAAGTLVSTYQDVRGRR